MQVSSRQRSIIEVLMQEQKGATVGFIAEHIGVSARTIHRELEAVEELLAEYGMKLMRKAGAGVEIVGTEEQKQSLRTSVLHQTTTQFTAQERKVIILCSLLEASEPVKLISLAIDLKVTTATISHDLDDLEVLLARYELSLLRKRGYGVELLGTESSKRRMISRLISEHLDDHEMIGVIKENIQNKALRNIDSISERLLGLIDREKLIKVENALNNLEDDLPYHLADSAYIGLVTHLALAVERVEKGENIHFDEKTLSELTDTAEYKAAERIIERLQLMFQMEIPTAEIGYITMHLRGAKLRHSQEESFWPENTELMTTTYRLIQLCEERLGVPLKEDSSLFHGLLTHLEPALYRLKRKMEIRNPILDQIKSNYDELFMVVQEAVAVVFPQFEVPEEEIGYLVMHLGAALERTRQEQQRYRALVVCSSGIGSSKILATRIKKEIPEIVSLQNLSMFDLGDIPASEYDLIISTIPLPLTPMEYVVVSPLLPPDDIQKIKFHLHSTGERQPVSKEMIVASARKNPVGLLLAMQNYSRYASDIVEGLWVREWDNRELDLRTLLGKMTQDLLESQAIQAVDPVVQQLLDRQKLGGLGIPGTSMALFHGRNDHVTKVSFTIHRLQEPLLLKSMDDEEMSIHLLLLMIGPRDVPQEGLEVLSELSSLLIEEELQSVLETGETQQIADYIADQLYSFCLKKIGWERTK
ncbi:BglG family transcription antiterminator [Brevibacillus reuszeri]|uniref:BglG family transcription antiterminator n=1 Tax=Brevibacillus reuszeri TaxID=54915 RepID=UPI0028979FA5|nr:BglG family transcription antiterminator [Brevibacillus reuszeri]